MNLTTLSRRQFLRQSAFSAGAILGFPTLAATTNPNSLVHVACVGVNGMGLTDVSQIGSHSKVKLVGFCDVDKDRFDKADVKFPNVPHFEDYRDMLAQLGDRCDAVSVSTPDHTHAPVALAAMRRQKHVFCQKPLAHTVKEVRQMRLQTEKSGLITQMGNQIHSAVEYRTAVRMLQQGVIGKIVEVHSYIGVHGRQHNNRTDRPPEAPVPANLNWDFWVGTAPMRPFATDAYHPFKWRDWQDFGSGALGDFGCHIMDPIFTALGLTAPVRIRAEHAGTNREVWPGPETIHYLFPGTSLTKEKQIKLVWRDGGLLPSLEGTPLPANFKFPKGGGGSLIIGEDGAMLLPHWALPRLYPETKFAGFTPPKVQGLNHWHVWIDAILAGKKTTDGFHYAGPLSETVQLGNIAARLPGQELIWDAEGFKFNNSSEANEMLTKPYRPGWEIAAG
jgi:predicted dehydrogenase